MRTRAGVLAGITAVGALILVVPPGAGAQDAPHPGPQGQGSAMVTALLGAWVQDDMGPVVTHRRRYDFRPDGSYEFVVTSRNTGSLEETVHAREQGAFAADATGLTIAPETAPPRSFPWRVERDPYVGDLRLVMTLPDGIFDVYYRE